MVESSGVGWAETGYPGVPQLPLERRVIDSVHSLAKLLLAALVAMLALAPSAHAVPPPNDGPFKPARFAPYNNQFGEANDQQGIAELAEARPDRRVPRCLGSRSFARTVWFRIDAASTAREITVEASGRTLEVVDLAAFVQNGRRVTTRRPNACVGRGISGDSSAEDRLSSITFNVPAGLPVLVQVGRRGPAESPDDERALLWMTDTPISNNAPAGDRANGRTPKISSRTGRAKARVSAATTTSEDPAVPECPAAGGVWRRMKAPRTGRMAFTASGAHAGALAVFSGRRPARSGLLGCVDREGDGPLVLPVRVRRGRWLWARVGSDRPAPGAQVRLRARRANSRDRLSGGTCLGAARPLVRGGLIGPGATRERNRMRRLSVRLRTSRGPVCKARMELVGPKGRAYARANVFNVDGAGQVVSLRRTRRFVRGRYVLKISGAGLAGVRTTIRTRVSFRLR